MGRLSPVTCLSCSCDSCPTIRLAVYSHWSNDFMIYTHLSINLSLPGVDPTGCLWKGWNLDEFLYPILPVSLGNIPQWL